MKFSTILLTDKNNRKYALTNKFGNVSGLKEAVEKAKDAKDFLWRLRFLDTSFSSWKIDLDTPFKCDIECVDYYGGKYILRIVK